MLATHSWSSRGSRLIALINLNPSCTSSVIVVPGAWMTQGPGQFHGHSPPIFHLSPALRLSYTTVPTKFSVRNIHTTLRWLEKESLKPSSQVEVTVQDLKQKAKAKEGATASAELVQVNKTSLLQRIKSEIIHYYHGFKLLFIDVRISSKYLWRTLNGDGLSRREYRQLIRTTSDLFRLLPFSVFIIIPFMEILLPVALKLFPGMLPSTFETANEKEAKMKKTLKVKLEMAKFLQQTLDNMAVQAKGHYSESAKEFVIFFEKVRKSGEPVSGKEILKFSKVFEDELTLDSLTRPQLSALCKLLEMQPFGTNNFLRFQLRMKLRALVADDKIIQSEGIESLAVWELQQACRSRGMRAYGMTEDRLKFQLKEWLHLSLNERVPPSLLLLSRSLYLPENIPAYDSLAATISVLPEELATRTKAAIGKKEGKIDNVTRLEVIKAEEKRIKEDKLEQQKELEAKRLKEETAAKKKQEEEERRTKESMRLAAELKIGEYIKTEMPEVYHIPTSPTSGAIIDQAVEVTKATVTDMGELKAKEEELHDKAEILEDKSKEIPSVVPQEEQEITPADLREVGKSIETLGVEKKKLLIEEQELQVLKTELADYEEDIENFKLALQEAGVKKKGLKESKGARRLFGKVNRMINRLSPVITAIRIEEEDRQKMVEAGDAKEKEKIELLDLQELSKHMKYITTASETSKIETIVEVLTKMDDDHDGAIKVEHVLKVLELLSEDQIGISRKMLEDVIVTLSKEDQLETQTLIQNALKISKDLKKSKYEKAIASAVKTSTAGKAQSSPTSSNDTAKPAPINDTPTPVETKENHTEQNSSSEKVIPDTRQEKKDQQESIEHQEEKQKIKHNQ